MTTHQGTNNSGNAMTFRAWRGRGHSFFVYVVRIDANITTFRTDTPTLLSTTTKEKSTTPSFSTSLAPGRPPPLWFIFSVTVFSLVQQLRNASPTATSRGRRAARNAASGFGVGHVRQWCSVKRVPRPQEHPHRVSPCSRVHGVRYACFHRNHTLTNAFFFVTLLLQHD